MTTRDALYADILANPDNDGIRLIYADWLEEYGNSNDQAQAEFIRIQIERDRRRRNGILMSDEERLMRDRENELLERFLEWFPMPKSSEFAPCFPRRGFIESVMVDACVFSSAPFEWLFTHHPITEVSVYGRWDNYSQVISAHIPKQLRVLRLSDSGQMTRDEVRSLVGCERHAGWGETLQELNVENITAPARILVLEMLPNVRLRLNGTLYSAMDEFGKRQILESPQTASPMPEGST
jgi:uncharacterized protein (TIGR02996 family)